LDELRVPFYPHLSGGKGTHTSIFLDPTSIVLPGATVARAQRAKVDVWTHVRMVVANAFLDAAEFPAGDDARWAPPIGNGVLDRLKIKWSALRNGSMVRVIGTPGSAGFRKTLVPRDFDWKAAAEWDAPKPAPLVFHGTPELWAVPRSINERIAAAIDAACGQAERAVDGSTREVQANPLKALAAVKAVPCVKHILDEPAPRGTRHYAFLNLAVTAKTLGLPHAGAQALLRQALAKCGLDETDPAWQTLNEVYAGGYRLMSPKCPSPHCTAWCNPNGCSFSGRFEFH
jgi:hypothetical protein